MGTGCGPQTVCHIHYFRKNINFIADLYLFTWFPTVHWSQTAGLQMEFQFEPWRNITNHTNISWHPVVCAKGTHLGDRNQNPDILFIHYFIFFLGASIVYTWVDLGNNTSWLGVRTKRLGSLGKWRNTSDSLLYLHVRCDTHSAIDQTQYDSPTPHHHRQLHSDCGLRPNKQGGQLMSLLLQ